MLRFVVEEGNGWSQVIPNMDTVFFKEAFAPLMLNPAAITEEEIQCEKYFLMLNHRNLFTQNGAMCYFGNIYSDVRECMEKEYHYTKNDFARDMINKGIAQFFIDGEDWRKLCKQE